MARSARSFTDAMKNKSQKPQSRASLSNSTRGTPKRLGVQRNQHIVRTPQVEGGNVVAKTTRRLGAGQSTVPGKLTYAHAVRFSNKTHTDAVCEPYEEVIAPSSDGIVHVISCNPRTYGNQRVLGRLGEMYMRYAPKSFRIHYIPRCSAMTNGEIIVGTLFHDSDLGQIADDALLAAPGGISFLPYEEATITIPVSSMVGKGQLWYACATGEDLMSEPFVVIMKVNSVETPGTVLGRMEIDWEYSFTGLKLGGDDDEDVPNLTVSYPAHPTSGPITVELATPEVGTWSWTSLLTETVPAALTGLLEPGIRYALKYAGAGAVGSLYNILDDMFQPMTTSSTYLLTSGEANGGIRYPRPTVEEVISEQAKICAQVSEVTKRKLDRFLVGSGLVKTSSSQPMLSTDSTTIQPQLQVLPLKSKR